VGINHIDGARYNPKLWGGKIGAIIKRPEEMERDFFIFPKRDFTKNESGLLLIWE
jgi:hypothetical protein